LTTLLFGSFLFAGCNFINQQPEVIDDCIIPEDCAADEPIVDDVEDGKSLILVFSPTGNTKRIATFI
jgi:hypothetical protein